LKIDVSTSLINDVISKAQIINPPPLHKGKRLDIIYGTKVNGQIPTFVLFGNDPKHLHLSYGRFMENQIRKSFGFEHVPITLYFKDKNARIRGSKEKINE
jgi:GTP-binding protein